MYPSVRRFPSFFSTPPATPCSRSSCPGTGSPGATTPAPPRVTASSRQGGSPDRASWPGVTPSKSSEASTSPTSCTTEDMDLCWRARQAGWGIGFTGAASVTHVQGVSTARHPYRMLVARRRSTLRFTVRTTSGWRRAALPLAAAVLGLRLVLATVRLAVTGPRPLLPGGHLARRAHGCGHPARGADAAPAMSTSNLW